MGETADAHTVNIHVVVEQILASLGTVRKLRYDIDIT